MQIEQRFYALLSRIRVDGVHFIEGSMLLVLFMQGWLNDTLYATTINLIITMLAIEIIMVLLFALGEKRSRDVKIKRRFARKIDQMHPFINAPR